MHGQNHIKVLQSLFGSKLYTAEFFFNESERLWMDKYSMFLYNISHYSTRVGS